MEPASVDLEELTGARELAVVLHDLVWLLPRTLDAEVALDPDLDQLPASELGVMRLLVRRPELTVSAVARELGLQRTNASAAVRSLIVRGLLERVRDGRDGRVARLRPTAAAIANRDRRERAWAQVLGLRLGRLPAPERERILASAPALRRLLEELAAS